MSRPAFLPHAISDLVRILRRHQQLVGTRKDIDAVHRIRVTSRRLRNALKSAQEFYPQTSFKRYGRQIKSLAQSFGNAL